jgi:hypothetical protein
MLMSAASKGLAMMRTKNLPTRENPGRRLGLIHVRVNTGI